ncbi:hypothetical protein, partial [Prosthecobacter sp.]|uniref:hypothetical protein n=1 Tax=Prosthecobacter sp. TaxID=1965333 RepID=UPI0025F8BAD1
MTFNPAAKAMARFGEFSSGVGYSSNNFGTGLSDTQRYGSLALGLLHSIETAATAYGGAKSFGGSGAKTTAPTVEDTVSLFHQGTLRGGQVSSTRGLSTSLSSDLSHYRPGGQLYEFQVPRSTYNQWLDEGLAIPKTDLHLPTGIVTPEIRVLPPASGTLNQYLVRPPGG